MNLTEPQRRLLELVDAARHGSYFVRGTYEIRVAKALIDKGALVAVNPHRRGGDALLVARTESPSGQNAIKHELSTMLWHQLRSGQWYAARGVSRLDEQVSRPSPTDGSEKEADQP